MTIKRTVAFSKHSTNVFFHILTQCNLKCKHCYINIEQHGRRMLSIETISEWLALFAPVDREGNLIFLGGEPTLHPDLSQAVKAARRLGYTSVTIDTNGYLFHDIIEKVDPADVDFFSFSLDGAKRETNDAIRGGGVYDTCLEGIRKTLSKGFGVSMIYTVSAVNLHELELMPALVENLGIHRFFIQVIGLRGKSAQPDQDRLQVSRNEWMEIVPRVARTIAESGITVTYPKVFLAENDPFECAGNVADNYFIFPNGRVYRCPLCEDYPIHSLCIEDNRRVETSKINENDLFRLTIPEGCVMNKLIQPDNIEYDDNGECTHRIACCLLKEEVTAS